MKDKDLRQRNRTLLLANVDNCEHAVHSALIAVDKVIHHARGDWTNSGVEKSLTDVALQQIRIMLGQAIEILQGEVISAVDDVNW